jgi:hypothetical protein
MHDIDAVISRLDEIIEEARRTRQGWGCFAAMYRRATYQVKRAIDSGLFDDGKRMSQLDYQLALHYFRALDAFRDGGGLFQSWEVALTAMRDNRCTLVQQLLLGMNAHIYLDLGIAAATTMRGNDYGTLHRDFRLVNDILVGELEPAQNRLGRLSPLSRLLASGMGRSNEWLTEQGRVSFRESAWAFGKKLSELDPAYWPGAVADRDGLVTELAWKIDSPSFPTSFALFWVRLFERRNVERNMGVLS